MPRYLTLDPALSRVPDVEGVPAHHPLLVAHVVFASVAMVTGFFQVWPRFRGRFRVAHRRLGRVYVVAGVLPAGLTGLVIGAVSPFGPMTRVGNALLALLWLGFTATGFRRARQHRHAEHRVWVVRGVALTMSVISNRVIGPVAGAVPAPHLDTAFGGGEITLAQTVAALSAWLGWVLPLLVVQWWLQRGSRTAQPGMRPTSRV